MEPRGRGHLSAWKAAGIAVALGAVAWFAAPLLLPVRVPADFPPMPDLRSSSEGLRALLDGLDRDARRRPGSPDAMGKLAMAYHANDFFEQAASAYTIAARLAPSDYRWPYYQAYLREETGNEREELVLLKDTDRLNPDYAPALMKLADASFKRGQMEQAERYYDRAAKLESAALQGSFGLGRVAANRQDWTRVIEVVEPLARAYSYVLPVHELLREAYEKLGKANKAAEARQNSATAKWKLVPPADDPLSEQLIDLSFSSTRLLKWAGLMGRVGRPDRALRIGRRAIEADPRDAGARNFVAYTILTFYGDQPPAVDEALTQLSECLRLKPDDLGPLWNFAGAFFDTPKTAPAIDRLQQIIGPYSNAPEAHYPLGMAADARGDTNEAIAQYEAALNVAPSDSAVYNKLGQVYVRSGSLDLAISALSKSVQLNPNNNGARLNLGVALMQSGRYTQATTELTQLLRRTPHDAPAHFCMGYALLYSKRADEAAAYFREGLKYKPDDAEAHYGLASALLARGQRQDAATEAREALKLRPDLTAARELIVSLQR